ncbi:hypothetical protein [Erwinia amylovora]|nr:hypothetical protein [Erwinia amylovora]
MHNKPALRFSLYNTRAGDDRLADRRCGEGCINSGKTRGERI